MNLTVLSCEEPSDDVRVPQDRFARGRPGRLGGTDLPDISLRDRLRATTADSHAALDATVAAFDIERTTGYAAFLAASAAALAPLELGLERGGVEAWLPDWPRRARREVLARDLAALGLATPLSPRPVHVPSPAFGAGLLYVLEGSRLGARFLARRARAAGRPLAYLTHGEGGDLWPSFLVWLEAIPKVGFWTDEAEAGARYGFRCFSDAFAAAAPPGDRNVRVHAPVRIRS